MNDLLLSSETILDSLSEGVYVCDRDRRIVFWSRQPAASCRWNGPRKSCSNCVPRSAAPTAAASAPSSVPACYWPLPSFMDWMAMPPRWSWGHRYSPGSAAAWVPLFCCSTGWTVTAPDAPAISRAANRLLPHRVWFYQPVFRSAQVQNPSPCLARVK